MEVCKLVFSDLFLPIHLAELDEELTSIEDEMKHLGSEVGRVVGGEEEEEELALILQTKATLRAQAQKVIGAGGC